MLLLAEVFVRDFCRLNNLPPRQLTDAARQQLKAHPFPGNVRELKAVVELATVLADGEFIRGEDLPLRPGKATFGPGSQLSLREQTTAIVQSCLDELDGDVLAVAARLQHREIYYLPYVTATGAAHRISTGGRATAFISFALPLLAPLFYA